MNPYQSFSISFPLRSYLGQYPSLFYSIYGILPKNRMLSVKRNTQLVIEGFPRSANTFAVCKFNQLQPTKLRIAHHMHVPAQVIKAVHWKIPTIVLIRNPKDVAVSLIMYDPRISIVQALKCYISFYKTIHLYRQEYIVADFNEIINNYSNIIQRTNRKFGTKFVISNLTDTDVGSVYQNIEFIEKIETSRRGAKEYSELQIARPSSLRSSLKEKLMENFETLQAHKTLKAAEEIYREFTYCCP